MTKRALYTTTEAAELLGIRKVKVCALIQAGRLRAVDTSVGSGKKPRWGIPADSLAAFIGGEVPQPPAEKRVLRRQRIDSHVKKVF